MRNARGAKPDGGEGVPDGKFGLKIAPGEGCFLMLISFRWFCLLASLAMLAGCAHSPRKRPHVYSGGQYYGDAVHAQDLKNQ